MATTAAQIASYAYPPGEKPEDAFSWWLSPCGGTDLVPDDIKRIFDILSGVPEGVSSFKKPKNIPKGSGKKGDAANPIDRSKPKAGTGRGPNGTGTGNTPKKRCNVPAASSTIRVGGGGRNTLREQSCVADKTHKTELIITSIAYGNRPIVVSKTCSQSWSQACFHYSSAISRNPTWATLTCPPAAGKTKAASRARPAVATWSAQHTGKGWTDAKNRQEPDCQADEYPPIYLLDHSSPAFINSGKNAQGQSIRYIKAGENGGAGSMWRGACFNPAVLRLNNVDFKNSVNGVTALKKTTSNPRGGVEIVQAEVDVTVWPEFTISSWGQQGNAPPDDGMSLNRCWPSGLAPLDPGFPLLTFDPWYNGKPQHPYDYRKPV